RPGSFWRKPTSFQMGEKTGPTVKVATVRTEVARAKRRHHTGRGFRRARRRLLSHLRVQQQGKRRGSGAAFENSAKLVTQTISSANRIHARRIACVTPVT